MFGDQTGSNTAVIVDQTFFHLDILSNWFDWFSRNPLTTLFSLFLRICFPGGGGSYMEWTGMLVGDFGFNP